MIEFPDLFTLLYVLLADGLFFLYAYPHAKDITRDLDESGAVAFLFTLMSAIFLLAGLFGAWIGLLAVLFLLMSIVSGYELIFRIGKYRVNAFLFICSIALSFLSLMSHDTIGQIAGLAQGGIWMIGIGMATNKHLLPSARSLLDGYEDESVAEVFVAICLVLCVLTLVAPFFGARFPWWVQLYVLSDLGFMVGGLMGYLAKKKGIQIFSKPTAR